MIPHVIDIPVISPMQVNSQVPCFFRIDTDGQRLIAPFTGIGFHQSHQSTDMTLPFKCLLDFQCADMSDPRAIGQFCSTVYCPAFRGEVQTPLSDQAVIAGNNKGPAQSVPVVHQAGCFTSDPAFVATVSLNITVPDAFQILD